jgi:twitching motility protein PilT
MDITRLLRALAQFKGSDLHVQADVVPTLRIDGELSPLDTDAVSAADVADMVRHIADERTQQQLESERSADFSYVLPDVARFRINAFHQANSLAFTARRIPNEVPTLDDLNLPAVIREITQEERGLILVTGTTGSGKSTTLAAMIDHLNRTRRLRIVTIEDPIEYVHESRNSLIAQRELGADTLGFARSLRAALRQDPDVLLVGELRDLETMRIALQAADTGHLVFSTMHTSNAPQTIQRLIALFPPAEHELLLTQLASNLQAVISQRLAKRREDGRLPVVEVMRDTPTVRRAIAEGRPASLGQAIANRTAGMQLFDQHITELYNADAISGTEALRLASNPEAIGRALRGISSGDLGGGLVQ